MVHRCQTTIQLQDFLSRNQMVTWIRDKKFGNHMVTTIQLTDYFKSCNRMSTVIQLKKDAYFW